MKKLTALILLISTFSSAQFYEIIYETQVQTHYNEKGLKWFEDGITDVNELNKIIEENKNPPKQDFKFTYSQQLSKTEHIPRIRNHQDENGPMIYKFPINIGRGAVNDYLNKIYAFEADVYGKKYTVKDNLKWIDFKETGKSKELLGFKVYEALGKYDNVDVLIWFTTEIPYQYSPEIYVSTKGFILETHYKYFDEESETITSWTAKSVKKMKSEPKIGFPKKGKEVKFSELDAIYDEANRKRNEMFNQESSIDKK